jgi:hypothetical protein
MCRKMNGTHAIPEDSPLRRNPWNRTQGGSILSGPDGNRTAGGSVLGFSFGFGHQCGVTIGAIC